MRSRMLIVMASPLQHRFLARFSLFATGLGGALGLLGWRRKRKAIGL